MPHEKVDGPREAKRERTDLDRFFPKEGALRSAFFFEQRPGLTLIVAELSPSKRERAATQQLRAALEPAATVASQLGVSAREAGSLFREMVEKSNRELKKESA